MPKGHKKYGATVPLNTVFTVPISQKYCVWLTVVYSMLEGFFRRVFLDEQQF